jgi:hypothetical protein
MYNEGAEFFLNFEFPGFTGQLEVLEITKELKINSRGFGAFKDIIFKLL